MSSIIRQTIVIERRFHGPPGSGHGGYTCGLVAREMEGAAQVLLRSPPPLERPLTLERDAISTGNRSYSRGSRAESIRPFARMSSS